MGPADSLVAFALVALCAHLALLLVVLVRGILPARRDAAARLALAAGAAALVGELLALGLLLGRRVPLPWLAGTLGLAFLLGFLARGTWRSNAAGRAAFYALFAAPLVAVLWVALALR